MSTLPTHAVNVSKRGQKIAIKNRAWHPQKPYNALPLLPPPTNLESHAILKACIPARAALAELKQASALIPNPAILINTLPLLEARASSEIENIVTSTDKLFQHYNDAEHADPATKEALRYSRALFEGYQALKQFPLTTRTAEEICSRIKGTEMKVRRLPGTALKNSVTGEIIYTPPEGENLLQEILANWEKFMHNEISIDPLVRMAVGHYQFEAIHPFSDGNGRTGRILNNLFLIEENLLTLPILYLSRYIIQHRADYYRLLLAVTSSDSWEPWILYVIRGIEETANWTMSKIAAIRELSEITSNYVRKKIPKIYTYELVNLLFELPYCRISSLVDRGIAKRQTASEYLQRLVEIGVLAEKTAGKEKLFIHPKLVELLTQEDNSFKPY